MTNLPEPMPTAPAAGQSTPTDADREQAARWLAALDEIPTHYRDDTPIPKIGPTPPVQQPGRPAMSEKAVDDTARMIGASVIIATTGGATTVVLWASHYANPVVVALVFGAPTALVLALGRLTRKAKETLPEEHHHHYTGPVYQDQRSTENRSVWAKTVNR